MPELRQSSIFDPPETEDATTAPFQAHSETSREAAESIVPKMRKDQARVLDYLRQHPEGATDEEMQDELEMNPSTQRPRRIELVQRGSARDSGEKRNTHSGRRAVIWMATEDARKRVL